MAIGFEPGSEMLKTVNKQQSNLRKSGTKTSSNDSFYNGKGLKYKKATPEQLEAIREKMKKSPRRHFSFMGVILRLLLSVIIYIILIPTQDLIFW